MPRTIRTALGTSSLIYKARTAGATETRTRVRNGVYSGGGAGVGSGGGRFYPSGIGPAAVYGQRASQDPTTQTVLVQPGTDVNAVCAAQPSTAVIALAAGVHRLVDVNGLPSIKTGQTIVGFAGASINGSKLLNSTWVTEGALRYHAHTSRLLTGANVPTNTGGFPFAFSGYERANDPNEVYRNGVRLRHMPTKAGLVAAGQSFYDEVNGRVYVHGDDGPTTSIMEIANTSKVVNASGVTLRNLIIEKVGNLRQTDANGGQQPAISVTNGLVEYCTIRLIHSTGVQHPNSPVRFCQITRMGQLGHGGGGSGPNFIFEYNEVSYCNESMYDWVFEAGASKYANTGTSTGGWENGIRARYNWSHHNIGNGMWADVENHNAWFEGNVVEDNTVIGIFQELGQSGRTRNNYSRFNGTDHTAGGRKSDYKPNGSNLCVTACPNVEVSGNKTEGGLVGIAWVDDNRRAATGGVCTGNTVIARAGTQAAYTHHAGLDSGLVSAITWNSNTYTVDSLASPKWWNGTYATGGKSFAAWQALGRDAAGSATVG